MIISRNRIIAKRINVRIEHVRPSKCRQDFLNRVKENELKKKSHKETGVWTPTARKVCPYGVIRKFFQNLAFLDCTF